MDRLSIAPTWFGTTEDLRILMLKMFSVLVQYMSSIHDSQWVITYVYSGSTFRFSSKARYSWTVAQIGDLYGSSTLHHGHYLVVPTFVARCLYVFKEASDPSGKRWNYLSKVCHVILQKRPLPRHLCKFLATNLRQRIEGDIEVMLGICVRNMPCATHVNRLLMLDLQIICATYDFVIWIAPTEEIRARTTA